MDVKDLDSNYHHFGNSGAVWGNKTHIAKSGPRTLCGTPMLSSNWARIKNHPTIGCAECLKLYKEETQNQLV